VHRKTLKVVSDPRAGPAFSTCDFGPTSSPFSWRFSRALRSRPNASNDFLPFAGEHLRVGQNDDDVVNIDDHRLDASNTHGCWTQPWQPRQYSRLCTTFNAAMNRIAANPSEKAIGAHGIVCAIGGDPSPIARRMFMETGTEA
jgi:hypothetical protein